MRETVDKRYNGTESGNDEVLAEFEDRYHPPINDLDDPTDL